ncbi:helix-turn-helix domain-containing protein [Sinorhizobium americanum]
MKVFCAVVETGSFAKAADRLGYVSIMALELIGQGLQAISVSCGEN